MVKIVTVVVVMEREEGEGEDNGEEAMAMIQETRGMEERGLTTSLAPAGGKEMRITVKVQDPMLTCKSLHAFNSYYRRTDTY